MTCGLTLFITTTIISTRLSSYVLLLITVVHSFIHSFIHKIFMMYLLCTRSHAKHWRHSYGQVDETFVLLELRVQRNTLNNDTTKYKLKDVTGAIKRE